MADLPALVFGPIPSRRLGRSLGINNIPPKSCSYSCVYCQVGPTAAPEIEPRSFYTPDQIVGTVADRLAQLRDTGQQVDHLTFVPHGEPTLDIHVGEIIDRLRELGVPIAVITNASLLHRRDVRERLAHADWVSVKIDAINDTLWRKINRPNPALDHRTVLNGIETFSGTFAGTLVTETMLVRDLNDGESAARELAPFLAKIAPAKAYLSVPIRPPAERGVQCPNEDSLNRFYQVLNQTVRDLEVLAGYEGDAFVATGDVVEDLLAIASVHPMRKSAVEALLHSAGATWPVVENLIDDGRLVRTSYAGHDFFIRRIAESENDRRTQ